MKIKRRNVLRIIRIIVYILIIVSILLLKYTNLINGKCYINDKFDFLCPTCGITRAIKAIVNFDFLRALKWNAYCTLVLFPTFLILFIDDVICMIINKKSLVEIILGE